MINCTFTDGRPAKLRHAVVGTIISRANQVLLVRRSATSWADPNRLAIPGGYMDRDESMSDAARREAKEETGYDVVIDRLFYVNDQPEPRNDNQNIVVYFATHPASDEPTSNPDAESSEVVWVPLDQLPGPDEMAFNHREILDRYRAWTADPGQVPTLFDRHL